MKKNTLLFSLILVVSAHAERIVVYDSTTSAVVSSFWGDPVVAEGRIVGTNKILVVDEFNSNLATILDLLNREISQRFWFVEADSVREMIQAEKDSVDFGIAVADTLNARESAKITFDGFANDPLYERAKLDIFKEEYNFLRAWIRDFKTEVAAATSLTNLKTRVAGLPDLNDRTLAQFKTKVKNKIDSKEVDSND